MESSIQLHPFSVNHFCVNVAASGFPCDFSWLHEIISYCYSNDSDWFVSFSHCFPCHRCLNDAGLFSLRLMKDINFEVNANYTLSSMTGSGHVKYMATPFFGPVRKSAFLLVFLLKVSSIIDLHKISELKPFIYCIRCLTMCQMHTHCCDCCHNNDSVAIDMLCIKNAACFYKQLYVYYLSTPDSGIKIRWFHHVTKSPDTWVVTRDCCHIDVAAVDIQYVKIVESRSSFYPALSVQAAHHLIIHEP